jgi:hypothetical protein
MKLLSKLKFTLTGVSSENDLPKVVTFSGGMGAQIISAAIYFSLEKQGKTVFADMSYFDAPAHVATEGNPGEISQWPWQLGPFGLEKEVFKTVPDKANVKFELIVDGLRKQTLALTAMQQADVQKRFPINTSIDGLLPAEFSKGYLCVHVRRGDYVNVASHLISDAEFIDLSTKFRGLVENLVVVSDSGLEQSFRQAISWGFAKSVFLDNIDAYSTHRAMRLSRILICSNSQFSLVAALLNDQALVVLPKQWFGGKDRALERNIQDLCGFQILA